MGQPKKKSQKYAVLQQHYKKKSDGYNGRTCLIRRLVKRGDEISANLIRQSLTIKKRSKDSYENFCNVIINVQI